MYLRLLLVFMSISMLAEARLPDLIPYRKGNLWGFSDSTKKIIIEPQWDEVTFFSGISAAVKKAGKWGMIDRSGKLIVEMEYDWIEDESHHGLRQIAKDKYGERGAISDSGKIIVPIAHEWLCWQGPFLEGSKLCYNGVYDSTGRVVIPFIYYNCGDYPEALGDSGLFPMCKKEKRFLRKPAYRWGVVDTAGNVIIPFKYYWITAANCGHFEVRTSYFDGVYYDARGNKIGLVDSCPPDQVWQGWQSMSNSVLAFEGANGQWGYRNTAGKVIFEPQFSVAHNFREYGIADVWIRFAGCEQCYGTGYVDIYGTKYWEE